MLRTLSTRAHVSALRRGRIAPQTSTAKPQSSAVSRSGCAMDSKPRHGRVLSLRVYGSQYFVQAELSPFT
eukprot:5508135-Prymnesium_polylepis.1